MGERGAQAAVEMIIILAVSLVLLASILMVNNSALSLSSTQLEETKARSSLDDIANAAELVYQGGVGSKTRVFVTLPGNIASTSVNNRLMQINLLSGGGGTRSIYRTTDFAVSGSIPTTEGSQWINVESKLGYVLVGAIAAPVCGNNVKEGSELCDGTDLGGNSCISQGYAGGALACQPSCTAFDTTGCVTQLCGNNIAEGTEACDGNDLRGETCASQGYAGGALACQPSCTAFDTAGCTSLTTCQQACSSIGFSSWLCRSSCTGAWKNAASAGNAYCAAQYSLPACCCK